MEGRKKRGLDGDWNDLEGPVEQSKKKRSDELDDDNIPIPSTSTSTATINMECNEDEVTDEEKDLKKLEQETCHLTDMNKFFPDLVSW